MKRVLFVTNGHGEAAIAQRLAAELRSLAPQTQCDHLALVGTVGGAAMHEVGPRRAMPSGGLIAMGNLRNLARDLHAGLAALTLAQARFLRGARDRYDAVVCVGDVYALVMAMLVRRPTIFVGSAKSIEVAPYGRFEARILARAAAVFVRDDPTAARLRRQRVEAEAANAIVDLFATPDDSRVESATAGFAQLLALFPGSRQSAYDDAQFLLDVTSELAMRREGMGAVLSIASGLDVSRFARDAQAAGWSVHSSSDYYVPFLLKRGDRTVVRAWEGPLGPLIARAALVLGQAGTANEGAAAAGVPVVAFARERDRRARWYRRRQQGLLGDALRVVPGQLNAAVDAVNALLDDEAARRRMGEIGRARMGRAGGAARIAARVVALLAST